MMLFLFPSARTGSRNAVQDSLQQFAFGKAAILLDLSRVCRGFYPQNGNLNGKKIKPSNLVDYSNLVQTISPKSPRL